MAVAVRPNGCKLSLAEVAHAAAIAVADKESHLPDVFNFPVSDEELRQVQLTRAPRIPAPLLVPLLRALSPIFNRIGKWAEDPE